MTPVPARGDIMILDMDPQSGKEIKKRRAVLVISEQAFNTFGLAVVCPITSTAPRHGFHVPLPTNLKTKGTIMSEQLKSLDYKARNGQVVEKLDPLNTTRVRQIISTFI